MALTEQNMEGLISVSEKLREIVNRVGRASTWLLVPLVIITMWDVVARKLVWIQIFMVQNFGSFFESTLMQEMEWHLHTVVFCLVLGFVLFTFVVLYLKSNPRGVNNVKAAKSIAGNGDHKLNKAKTIASKK